MRSRTIRNRTFVPVFTHFTCLLLLLGSFAFSQTSNTSLSGIVKDQQDRVMPNANVVLTNADTSTSRTQTTGPEGRYSFDLLTPGDYKLEVQASGFRKQMLQDIHVLIAQGKHARCHNAGRGVERGSHCQCRI